MVPGRPPQGPGERPRRRRTVVPGGGPAARSSRPAAGRPNPGGPPLSNALPPGGALSPVGASRPRRPRKAPIPGPRART